MNSQITITGLIATTPRHLVTQEGLPITSFRLAQENDGTTIVNWFTITAFKVLAINAATSLSKGDRIVVSGELRLRDWDNGETQGTSAEIEARTIGHDLNWSTSVATRTVVTRETLQEETPKHDCDCDKCDK